MQGAKTCNEETYQHDDHEHRDYYPGFGQHDEPRFVLEAKFESVPYHQTGKDGRYEPNPQIPVDERLAYE